MGLFSRKEKVSLDTFCRDFYDRNIIHPIAVNGTDAAHIFWETIKKAVAEADPRFVDVNIDSFAYEMTVIRFEVFGVAWIHQLGDKYAAAQSDFTKKYLQENDMTEMWKDMEPYNQVVAHSSELGQTSDTPTGRTYLTFTNQMRMDLFKTWCKKGFDPEVVARATNRISTEVAWKDGRTAFYLMVTLLDRLNYDLVDEARSRLTFAIRGLYDGARDAMKGIKIEV